MKPLEFAGANCTYAKDQPEYLPLPAFKDDGGQVLTCWGLTWRERIKLALTGRVWFTLLTFNQPLQPMNVSADNPLKDGGTP